MLVAHRRPIAPQYLEGIPLAEHPTVHRYPPMASNQAGDFIFITSFYDQARAVASRMEPAMSRAFLQVIEDTQKRINLGKLRAALAGGNLKTIDDAAGVNILRQRLGNDPDLLRISQRTTTAAGAGSAEILEDVTGLDFQFNHRDPRVIQYAREHGAQKIAKDVGEQAREAVRFVVASGADYGLTSQQQARAIREVVGLPSNWARAPLNLRRDIQDGNLAGALNRRLSAVDKAKIRSRMQRGTVTPEFLDEIQERYSQSLIHRRAKNIARTETLDAAHEGQRQSWTQAIEEGVLPQTTRRFWIVTADDRLSEDHAVIPGMNPEGRGMDEPFDTLDGPRMNPPLRTNCRCGTGLMIPRPGTEGAPLPTSEPAPDAFPMGGFASEEAAKKWAKVNIPDTLIRVKGLAPDVRDGVLQEMYNLQRSFPIKPSDQLRMMATSNPQSIERIKKGLSEANAFYSGQTQDMILNLGKMSDSKAYLLSKQHDMKVGWSAKGDKIVDTAADAVRSTVVHEYGHHLDYMMENWSMGQIRPGSVSEIKQKAMEAVSQKRDDWVARWGRSKSFSLPSAYARTNAREAFAETFAQVWRSTASSADSTAVSEMREIIQMLRNLPES